MKQSQNNKIFPVILQEEEKGGYTVINPSFDGCYSQGDTIEDALRNIKEATELCLPDNVKSKFKKTKTPNISLHFINLPEYA